MKKKYPLSPKEFKTIFSKVPRITVEVVLRTKEGVVLTLRSLRDWHNQWHTPGGGVLYRESLLDAVRRVARRELGVKVHTIRFVGHIEYESDEKERGFGHTIGLVFVCSAKSLHFVLDDGASDVKSFMKFPKNMVAEQKKFLRENWSEIFRK